MALVASACSICIAQASTAEEIAFGQHPLFSKVCGKELQTIYTDKAVAWSCNNLLAVMNVPTASNTSVEMEAELLQKESVPQVVADAKKDCQDLKGEFTIQGKKSAPTVTCKTSGTHGKFTVQARLEEVEQGTAMKITMKGDM